jgi:hypothetical protein
MNINVYVRDGKRGKGGLCEKMSDLLMDFSVSKLKDRVSFKMYGNKNVWKNVFGGMCVDNLSMDFFRRGLHGFLYQLY